MTHENFGETVDKILGSEQSLLQLRELWMVLKERHFTLLCSQLTYAFIDLRKSKSEHYKEGSSVSY